MIFKVPNSFEGSCVLGSIGRALSAGTTISISGNDLYALDIKEAIEKKILVPVKEKYDAKMKKIKHDVIIKNKTNSVLVLGELLLRPLSTLPISKDKIETDQIKAAVQHKLVEIISDEEPVKVKTVKSKKKKKKKSKKKVVKAKKYVPPKTGEDINVNPVVWDFRDQSLKEGEKPPKTEEVIRIDEGKDKGEDIDFIDDDKKKAKKKTKKRKKTKKKKSKKNIKKKGISTKKKNIKEIKPIGDKKLPKTQADAAIELDSRGKPLGKPSDTLQHMIDVANEPEDVGFADDDLALERYNKRKDME
jgi:hypothetical protein